MKNNAQVQTNFLKLNTFRIALGIFKRYVKLYYLIIIVNNVQFNLLILQYIPINTIVINYVILPLYKV